MEKGRGFVIAFEEIAPGTRLLVDPAIPKLSSRTSLSVPVRLLRGRRDGPALCVSAAVHGDDLNVFEIIRRVLASLPRPGDTSREELLEDGSFGYAY